MADRHILYKLVPALQWQKIVNAGDVDRGVIEVSSDVTITSDNVSTYNGNLLYYDHTAGTFNLNLGNDIFTIGDKLYVKHFGGSGRVTIATHDTGLIDGEVDITLGSDNGVELQYIGSNNWQITASHSAGQDMQDNYVDGITRQGRVITFTRTGDLDDITLTIPISQEFNTVTEFYFGEQFFYEGALYQIATASWLGTRDQIPSRPVTPENIDVHYVRTSTNPTAPFFKITENALIETKESDINLQNNDSDKLFKWSKDNLGVASGGFIDDPTPRVATAEATISTNSERIEILEDAAESTRRDGTLRDEIPSSSTGFPEVYISDSTHMYISFTNLSSFPGYDFTLDVINEIEDGAQIIIHSTVGERRAVFELNGNFDFETQISGLSGARYRRYAGTYSENTLTAADVDTRVEIVLTKADFSSNFVTRQEYNQHLHRFVNIGAREFNFIPSGTSYGSYDGNGWFLATQPGDPSELSFSAKVDKGMAENIFRANSRIVGADTLYDIYFGEENGTLEYMLTYKIDSEVNFSDAVRIIGKVVAVVDGDGNSLLTSGFPVAADEPLHLLTPNNENNFESLFLEVDRKQDREVVVMHTSGGSYTIKNGLIDGDANPINMESIDGTFDGTIFYHSNNIWVWQGNSWRQIRDSRVGSLITRVDTLEASRIDVLKLDSDGGTDNGALTVGSPRQINMPTGVNVTDYDLAYIMWATSTGGVFVPSEPIEISTELQSGDFYDVFNISRNKSVRVGNVNNDQVSINNTSTLVENVYVKWIVLQRI